MPINKNHIRFVIRLIGALVIASLAVTGAAALSLSNSGGGSWQYQRDITISNTGGALSDYQVLVSLTSGNFPTNAQTSGADIRFTDASGAELSYWIESWDYSGRSAKIWVKVSSIPAGGSVTIRMYYGNPSATSASNGGTVFLFFDDFLGSSLDSSWINIDGTTIAVSNSILNISYSSSYTWKAIRNTYNFPVPSVITAKMKMASNYLGFGGKRWPESGDNVAFEASDGWRIEPSFGYPGTSGNSYNFNQWYIVSGYAISGSPKILIDNNPIEQVSATYSFSSYSLTIATATTTVNSIDWILVRKYASSEPALTLGAEQPIVPPTTVPPTTVPPTTVPPTTVPPTTVPPTTVPPTTVPPTTVPPTTVPPTTVPPTMPPTLAVKQPMLTVSHTTLKEEPEVGEEVLITVTVQNNGDGTAKNIRLTEQLPSSISVSYIDGAISNTPNLVTWNGELAPNRIHMITHALTILEKRSRAIPVIIRYEDEQGNPKETSTTIYVEAQVPATPTPTPYSTPRVTGFNSLLVLIGLMVAILLVRRR